MTNYITQASMGLLLVAAVPGSDDPTLWAQWGLAGLVVGYTLWRDWHRERRMSEAIERNQEWVRNTLLRALERNTVALEKMTDKFSKQERE